MPDEEKNEGGPKKGDLPDLLKRLENAPPDERWKVHLDLVYAHYDADDYSSALESYEACADHVPDEKRSELVIKITEVLEQYGDLERATSLLTTRLEELEDAEKGNSKEAAQVHLRTGQVLWRQGRLEEGMDHCQMALAVHTDVEVSIKDQALVLSTMGLILWEKGDYEMALKMLQRALDTAEEVGLHEKLRWINNNMGLVNYQLGNYEEALDYFEKARPPEDSRANRSFKATLVNNEGLVYHDRGAYDEAREHYQRSLDINEGIENFVGCSLAHLNLGLLEVELGHFDKGRDHLDQSLSMCREMKEMWIRALDRIGLARAYRGKGEVKLARHNAERALELAEETKATELRGMALRELGLVLQMEEEFEKVLDVLEESLGIFENMNNRYEIAKSHLALGIFFKGPGEDPERGRSHLDQGKGLASDIGAKGVLADIEKALEAD